MEAPHKPTAQDILNAYEILKAFRIDITLRTFKLALESPLEVVETAIDEQVKKYNLLAEKHNKENPSGWQMEVLT